MKKSKKVSRSDELNQIIRAAAMTLSVNGSIDKLAEAAQVSGESIRRSIREGDFTVGLASALELTVGREHIKREDLCSKLAS